MLHDRLLKLLNMSTSDNDHEALTAIRLANKMVGGNWNNFLKSDNKEQPKQAQPESEAEQRLYKIECMFKEWPVYLPYLSATDIKWIENLQGFFESYYTLSDKQFFILENILNKCKNKHKKDQNKKDK